jgi:two-component system response regulator MtrA
MASQILLVEDDPSIRELTTLGLRSAGYEVNAAADGRDGLERFERERPDAVVLDIMLPILDGLAVCRAIRAQATVPIIMLTARTDTYDVVIGLEAGADDYVRKPFELPELLARLRAALRRVGERGSDPPGGGGRADPADGATTGVGTGDGLVRLGPIEIDEAGHTARRDGVEIALTHTEFRLLLELARRPGQVFTRDLLLDRVWEYDYLGDSRLVDVAVQRLRAKIETEPSRPTLILTVRGLGYKAVR